MIVHVLGGNTQAIHPYGVSKSDNVLNFVSNCVMISKSQINIYRKKMQCNYNYVRKRGHSIEK